MAFRKSFFTMKRIQLPSHYAFDMCERGWRLTLDQSAGHMFASRSTAHSRPCLGNECASAKAVGSGSDLHRSVRKGENEHFGLGESSRSNARFQKLECRAGLQTRDHHRLFVRPALAEAGGPHAGRVFSLLKADGKSEGHSPARDFAPPLRSSLILLRLLP